MESLSTLNDVCEDIRRIASASDLPMLVDADTGWGSAFMIARTVREMIWFPMRLLRALLLYQGDRVLP